jgi:UDP-glucose 4-epimerase
MPDSPAKCGRGMTLQLKTAFLKKCPVVKFLSNYAWIFMKYLITGGAGFIGSHLTEELIEQNHHVIVVDDLSSGNEKNITPNAKSHFLKTRIQDISHDYINKLDGIFHLAAQASVPVSINNCYESSLNNINSSLKVFDIARHLNIPVVFASSSAIYGNLPVGDDEKQIYEILSPYAQDKLTLEAYAKLFFNLYGISSIGLRFFNVYGPRQDPTNPYSGVISIFIDRFLKKLPVQINGGYQTRDFIYVNDIVKVLILSLEHLLNNKMVDFINVGTSNSISVDQLFKKLTDIMNIKPEKIYKPLPEGDPEKSSGVFNKLYEVLRISPSSFTKFNEGLVDTVEYFRGVMNEKI